MPGPRFIDGDVVDLHVVEEDDLPYLQRLINDPTVWRTIARVGSVTMEDERAFYDDVVRADDQEHLLITVDDQPVGTVGLADIDTNWGVAELGYFVDPAARGNGYATAGVTLLATYAFEQRRLEKLIAYVLSSNEPSCRVLEKNDFEVEGRLRDHAFVDGQRTDVIVYGRRAGSKRSISES